MLCNDPVDDASVYSVLLAAPLLIPFPCFTYHYHHLFYAVP